MSAAATLLERLETLIREESRRQREHLESQSSLPLGECVRKGYALEGLSYVGTNERMGNLVFKCMTKLASREAYLEASRRVAAFG